MIAPFAIRHVKNLTRAGLAIACTFAVGACSADAQSIEEETEVRSISQPIINGTPLTGSPLENAVEIGGCSGVSLDQEWILTAKHCMPALTAGMSTVTKPSTSETRVIREIHLNIDQDIALVRIFPFVGAVQALELWDRAPSLLTNLDLFCFGRGNNTANPPSGFGTWRYATMRISNPTAWEYDLLPNALGQIQTSGDSGGACLYYGGNATYVTGIQSTSTPVCPPNIPHCTIGQAVSIASASQIALWPGVSSWIKDIRQRSELLFYRNSDGVAATAALERLNTYSSQYSTSGFSTQWTHVVGLRNGSILFYNKNNGAAASGRLDKTGLYSSGTTFSLLPNWVHITAVGPDGLFFLDAGGTGRTARIDAYGTYTSGSTIYNFPLGATHVVGTKAGGLLVLNGTNGTALTATVNSLLQYTYGGSVSGFATNWTHVAAVNDRGLFFYNKNNGVAYSSGITSTGSYVSYQAVTGAPSGVSVVGASNGTLLFRNAAGTGTIGVVNTGGQFVTNQVINGFASSWTNVTVE